MHALLFQNQNALRKNDLVRYARQLGLDTVRFEDELRRHVYEERVRADFRAGVQNGVYGTPGLFLNGVRYEGKWDTNSLYSALTSCELTQ